MSLASAVQNRWFAYLCAASLTLGFVALQVWNPLPLQILRLKTFDTYQRIQPRPYRPMPVVIVDIDEESLKAYGQWPWPRSLIATLTNRLMALHVAAIGFDTIFAEKDRLSPDKVMGSVPGLTGEQRELLAKLPNNDALLAGAIGHARVVLGQAITNEPAPGQARDGPDKTRFAKLGADPLPFVSKGRALVRNLPELERAASGIGLLSLVPEPDGLIRRVPLVMGVGHRLYPTLSVELLRVAVDAMTPNAKINTLVVKTHPGGIESIVIPGFREIETDASGRAWVNFSPSSPHRYISAKDVLDGRTDLSRLEGFFALVGTSAAGLKDVKATPVSSAMPGVEVHAQLLETILSDSSLRRPGYAFAVELVLLLVICGVIVLTVSRLGPVSGLIAGLAAVSAAVAGSWYAYADYRLLISPTNPVLAGFTLYTTLTFLNFLRDDAEKRRVRSAFSQYLSPSLVDELARNTDKLRLGGEIKDMTVLFCDIRGFTTIAEQFRDRPEGLTNFINRYLTPLSDVVLSNEGTIDKYMGDCIMAFWNAPLDDPDHAAHGCASALSMLDAVAELNERRRAEDDLAGQGDFIPIRMGFGLNSGQCCVGNMGSEQRFDYSVIGDDVNLAARLEGQCKTYDVDAIAGEGTKDRAPDFAWLELDLIRVKGKTAAERIFALMGDVDVAAQPWFRDLASRNTEMLAGYRAGDWERARTALESCRRTAREAGLRLDGFYAEYERRIALGVADPRPADWDPVYAPTEK